MLKKLKYDFYQIGEKVEKVIVAIHGWKGDSLSMKPIIKSLKISNVACYFPEAPYKVLNDVGWSWSYQISGGEWEVDEPTQILQMFFNELFKKYSSEKIYVVGFSQGGLICFDFILLLEKPLGGVFPICGFLRDPKVDKVRLHPNQKKTPILIGHGKSDDKVPVSASKNAYSLLNDLYRTVLTFSK